MQLLLSFHAASGQLLTNFRAASSQLPCGFWSASMWQAMPGGAHSGLWDVGRGEGRSSHQHRGVRLMYSIYAASELLCSFHASMRHLSFYAASVLLCSF
mmetsp:Transcript_8749/g.15147  ORF Transcript_8749/g.15147 Transcript_8749/m.15147 type:complete len:99 (+) Transcript_8749:1353-1649(+)